MKLGSVGVAEEGTPSIASRYWAFKVVLMQDSSSRQGAFLICDKDFYGKDQGKIISRLDPSHPNFRTAGFISMSPCGNYVWIGDSHYIYSRDLSTVRTGKLRGGHADMGTGQRAERQFLGLH